MTGGHKRHIYFDHNATGPTAPDVVAAMLPYFAAVFANPSSSHDPGEEAAGAVHQARTAVQALVGAAAPEEIIFTASGTEADNLALYQACHRADDRNEVIISAVEHAAVLNTAYRLQKHYGLKVHCIGVDARGGLDHAAFRAALSPRTALVSVMWANNETGRLFPVAELARQAQQAGALFHTDAVQVAGKIPISLQDTAIDMLSLSAHKFHGPKGVGALYVRRGIRLQPLISGGRQERGRRAGTENLPAIVGLGAAAKRALQQMAGAQQHVTALRDAFEAAVCATIPGAVVIGGEDRLGGTSCIAFDGAESEVILHHLNRAGVAASAGSACNAGMMEPSHVLRAMHLPYTLAQGAVRFSFDAANTEEETGYVAALLPALIAQAREASPFVRQPHRAAG